MTDVFVLVCSAKKLSDISVDTFASVEAAVEWVNVLEGTARSWAKNLNGTEWIAPGANGIEWTILKRELRQ